MNLFYQTTLLLCFVSSCVTAQNSCADEFKTHYNAGEYQEAIARSENCTEINENAELRYCKSRCYMYLAQYDLAIQNYKALYQIDSKNVDYLNGMGAAYYMLERYDSALVYLNKTLDIDPKHVKALSNRKLISFMNYEYDKTLADLQTLLQLEPNNSNLYVDLGDVYYYLEDTTKSAEAYHKALEINPDNSIAFMSLAELYSSEEAYEKAQYYVDKGLSITQDDALLFAVQGDIYYFQDGFHYKEALKAYLNSFELDEDADVAYYIGLCYKKLEDEKQAIVYFQKAISLNSNDPDYYTSLAYLLFDEQPYEAITLTEKASALDPTDYYAYGLKGDIQFEMALYEEAIESYTQSLAVDSSSTEYLIERGIAYSVIENEAAAINDFTKSIEKGVYVEDCYFNRALVYMDQENYALAKADLDQYILLAPGLDQAYLQRGICNSKLGNLTAACEDMRTAASIGNSEAKSYVKKNCKK